MSYMLNGKAAMILLIVGLVNKIKYRYIKWVIFQNGIPTAKTKWKSN